MDDLKQFLSKLAHSAPFWVALIGFGNALQRWILPQVPDYVMASGNALIGVIATIIAGEAIIVRYWSSLTARVRHALRGLAV